MIEKVERSASTALTLLDVILLTAESLRKLLAVPHQQLLFGLHWSDGVEVDVLAVLARHQVLFGQRARRVDISHPVAPVDIIAINEVLKLPTAVNLQEKERETGIKTRLPILGYLKTRIYL